MKDAPWFKFYGNIPLTINYPNKTMFEMISDAAQKFPDKAAYEFMGKKTSYPLFVERIELCARALKAAGINKGDRVSIAMPNTPQGVDMFYAVNRIGAVANMIHPLSAPEEIRFYLDLSKSRLILTIDKFISKISEIIDSVENPVKVVVANIGEELPLLTKVMYNITMAKDAPKIPQDNRYITWKSFIEARKAWNGELPVINYEEGRLSTILYSGGTSGTTKGIMLSDKNFNALGLQTIAASGLDDISGLKMLSVMPLFHGFGLGIGIHAALIGGCTCILVPQFNIKIYANLLKKKKPNFIPGVPTLFEALLRIDNLDGVDLSFLKGVFSGGDSLSIELKAKVNAFLTSHKATVQIREGYGTTECVTASCLTPPKYYREGSIGVPYPDMFYKIVKPGTTEEVPAGEEGEIVLTGPTVMLGYLNNEKETADALKLHEDGEIWLHTGDLGKMDEDGFVYFRQRIKRMIITSGYNVYPSQIENILDGHDKVLISCVIGVPDIYKKQKVKAFVVPAHGVRPSEELKKELLQYCSKKIAKYAIPYDIEFRDELPKTLVGKVAYRKLEEDENAKLEKERKN